MRFDPELAGYCIKLRRTLGLESPMNVWRKTFTRESVQDQLNTTLQRDDDFMFGERWPVGATLNIKRPPRYVNRIGGDREV